MLKEKSLQDIMFAVIKQTCHSVLFLCCLHGQPFKESFHFPTANLEHVYAKLKLP